MAGAVATVCKWTAFSCLFAAISIAASAQGDEAFDESTQAQYEICLQYLREKKHDEALKCLQEVTETTPTAASAFYYIGLIYINRNDYASAVKPLSTVLSLSPGDDEARSFLIESYLKIGQVDAAIRLAIEGDAASPKNLAFKARLVRCYELQGAKEKAAAVRRELFRCRNEENITEGLASKSLYVRDVFVAGGRTVYALEYFTAGKKEGPKWSFRTALADGNERVYRLEYHAELKGPLEMEAGEGAEPYFLDAYDGENGEQQSQVTAFLREPTYYDVKAAVIKDLTQGRQSFYVPVDSPTSTTPARGKRQQPQRE
jgi:tetratricopeptide (TPR) repeat protein